MNTPIVKMEDIHKWYGKVYAVNGAHLSIYPGEVVGLVGDNGAGKSTLVKILSGLIRPNRGTIYFQDQKVEINSVREARELGIETVHQDQGVVGDRAVFQNIFLGREAYHQVGPFRFLDDKKMCSESEAITNKLGLHIATPEQEVRFCSGGERQGVAIARAMYFRAQVIILDEPTTALSPKGSRQVLQFIEQLKDEGVGTLFVTHNLREVHPVADRFVVMSHGKTVADMDKGDTSVEELEEILLA